MTEPAEPREAAAAAAGPAARALRLVLRLGMPLAVLAALLLLGAQLISARIPEQRAALEQLLREETGLEVTFQALTVHWGWYGPEARFHEVTLAPPGQPPLLHATRLAVTLDLWRSARSGRPEAGRIALFGPQIELNLPRPGGDDAARGRLAGGALAEPLRRLRAWRGGRIDLWRGTLRLLDARGSPLTLGIEHAQLRRLGARWSADARLTLPPELGNRAHLLLNLDEQGAGTLALEGRQLNLAGWRPLASSLGGAWPLGGDAELSLSAKFASGTLLHAEAEISARSLLWGAAANGAPLELSRLAGRWRLRPDGAAWTLEGEQLEVGAGTGVQARLRLERGRVRGALQNAPLEALAALARWQGWPEAPVHLGGRVPRLAFAWDAGRPRGQRLSADADLEELRIADGAQDHALEGLRAHLQAQEGLLQVALQGERAALTGGEAAPEALGVQARLALSSDARGWQLAGPLELTPSGGALSGDFTLRGVAAGAALQLDARGTVRGLDLPALAARFAAHYAPLARLTAGRIEGGSFEVHERLDAGSLARPLDARTNGTLELRGLALEGEGAWPALQRLDAQLAVHAGRATVLVHGGAVPGFSVDSARLAWRVGSPSAHLQAHLHGRAEEAIAWLRAQADAATYLPAAADLVASGPVLLELDLTGAPTLLDASRSRASAVLDGVRLQPLAGLPALEALHGLLRWRAGTVQGSASGRWLEGSVSLTAGTRNVRDVPVVTLAARGVADLRGLLPGEGTGAAPVSGSSEWNAQLTLRPRAGTFTLSADAPLTGVASHLPEPLRKSAASALPAHLEAQGTAEAAQLRFRLGERLGGVLALARGPQGWRIERGAVACGAMPPALPTEPVLALSGATPQLDLPAYLALWQQQSRAPVLPPVTAQLSAAELRLGDVYRNAELTASVGPQGGSLELRGEGLNGAITWPAAATRAHPAQLRLAHLTLQQPGAALAEASGLLDIFGPALHVSIAALRSGADVALGEFTGTLARSGERLDLEELLWRGPQAQAQASGRCQAGGCELRLTVSSADLAAALASLGWRADLAASAARLEGEVRWQPGAADTLATLGGHLHMQIEDGEARAGQSGAPFPLFVVPALLGSLQPTGAAPQPLPFQRLSADFELEQGTARTVNMHFDGEAEILVRGRIGLSDEDYEGAAVILRGEDRLPQAMRRLAPTPRVAALWLSLRDWLAGRDRALPTLYLRGHWQDPIVTATE